MDIPALTDGQIREVFARAGFGTVANIHKIPVGFLNDVYDVDSRYILKSGKWTESEALLKKEIYACSKLKDVVLAPRILVADDTHTVIDRTYIIFEKIQGENLYQHWHELSNTDRRSLVEQIVTQLRAINKIPYEEFAKRFATDMSETWRNRIIRKIKEFSERAVKDGGLSQEFSENIAQWVAAHASALDTSVMALTYYDIHFDNFLVQGSTLVGMLDFELLDVTSIDFTIDIVQRMVAESTKYASEASKVLIKSEDYALLMGWYRELYPEAFDFEDMETRLDLYTIMENVEQLHAYPHLEKLRDNLRAVLA